MHNVQTGKLVMLKNAVMDAGEFVLYSSVAYDSSWFKC